MTHLSGVRFMATGLGVASGRTRRVATVDDREHLAEGSPNSDGPSRPATVTAFAGRVDAPHEAMR
jgi:hypothetical protein